MPKVKGFYTKDGKKRPITERHSSITDYTSNVENDARKRILTKINRETVKITDSGPVVVREQSIKEVERFHTSPSDLQSEALKAFHIYRNVDLRDIKHMSDEEMQRYLNILVLMDKAGISKIKTGSVGNAIGYVHGLLNDRLKMKQDPRYVPSNTKEQVDLVRKIIKQVAPGVSVRQGRGTAYSWIDMEGSGPNGHFTKEEQAALTNLGLEVYGSHKGMDTEERKLFLERHVSKTLPV